MSVWSVIQVCIELILLVSVFILWVRALRSPKEDPRLSRGLQLLQSKIAVLEDLSDRTDQQSEQLIALIEKKCIEIQKKIELAESQVESVNLSIEKSREVANIFQDKIPHEEIIKRQKTIEMVKAARLSNQGVSFDEISQQVDLPQGELEFVVKVNRDQLIFNEDLLPSWAYEKESSSSDDKTPSLDFSHVFDVPEGDKNSLKVLGDKFRQACRDQEKEDRFNEEPVTKKVGIKAKEAVNQVGQKIEEIADSILNADFKNEPQEEDDEVLKSTGNDSNRGFGI